MFADLLLPQVLVHLVVHHGSPVLGQLMAPELVGVDLVPVVHGHVLQQFTNQPQFNFFYI